MADTIVTISLRKRLVKIHETRRRKMAINYLRQSIAKISKVDEGNVRINADLNEFMTIHSGKNMSRLELKITKDANKATVSLLNPVKKTAPVQEVKKETKPAAKKTEEKKEAKAAAPKEKVAKKEEKVEPK
ncbi:MAG: hypothetical protein ACREBF_02125 [Candidatus Micrarchaeales archaeon]